ncbi:MAG TPA: hypothetical protein VFJ90_05025 [Candidatus Didemnitutus sp.]|nr:hypothetical protein [Candidatus Didemnitutus sp.]
MRAKFATIVLGLTAALATASASNEALVTSVFSKVSNGYMRKKLPDGTYQREYYAIANGQYAPGQEPNDSIDKVKFPTIAGLVAQHLAKQNYFLAQDSKSAEILLLISWGTTIPYSDNGGRNSMDAALSAMNRSSAALQHAQTVNADATSSPEARASAQGVSAAAQADQESQMVEVQMFEDMRRKADEHNARLLGYAEEINNRDNPSKYAGAGSYFDDLKSDIEEERYYVIVSAYDFRTAVHDGKRKLLWATRMSIRAQGNRFDERLAAMLANADGYFGRNSKELIRQYQNGHVDIGEMKVVGTEPAAPAKPPEAK